MARIYPVFIGYFFLMVGLAKTNFFSYCSLDFAREILKHMNEIILLYIIEYQKTKSTKTKPTVKRFSYLG